jgi:hypothetical protein
MNVISKIHQIITGYEKKEAKGFEVWMVYWKSIRCDYWRNPVERAKSFIDKNDAEIFAKSLDEANALLQNDFEIKVRIVKQK